MEEVLTTESVSQGAQGVAEHVVCSYETLNLIPGTVCSLHPCTAECGPQVSQSGPKAPTQQFNKEKKRKSWSKF